MSKPKGAMGTEAARANDTSMAGFFSNALDNYTNNINKSQGAPQKPKKDQPKKEPEVKVTEKFDADVKQELLEVLVSNKLNVIEANDNVIIFETKDGKKMVILPAEEK